VQSSRTFIRSRRARRLSISVLFMSALLLGACGGDDAAPSGLTLPPLGASQTSPGTGPTTTRALAGASTTAPVTTRGRACDANPGVKCINIRSLAVEGNAVVVVWEAINFTPSLQSFHAHFFWDTVSPKQAGTNAAKFGATVGTWELTDKQPFRSEGELRVANRPAAAKQVCVTVADVAHALVDPAIFDCIALPA
jgi:hypothetical protein